MLIFFKDQILKLLQFFIYIFSFIESKFIFIKNKYFSKEISKEYYYYKNKELVKKCKTIEDNKNLLKYDKKLIINYGRDMNYSNIYVNENMDIKTPVKNKNYFITIDINITEYNSITSYNISLKFPLNFYFTNTPLLCYEHVHFLMNYYNNIKINKDTIYDISIMDKNFDIVNIFNQQYIEFNDDGNYEIKS